jgi:hypothetical protein
MFLGGFSYQCLQGQEGQNTSHMLSTNSPPTFVYSHLVMKAKFPMLSNTKESLISALEEKETFDQKS